MKAQLGQVKQVKKLKRRATKISPRASSSKKSVRSEEVQQVLPPLQRRQKQDRSKADIFPLTSAAHELKTPLAVMIGYTDLLRTQVIGPLTERQRQVLDDMQQNASRLQRFIEDLLLLGAMEFGKDKLNLEADSINASVKEIFDYWAPRANEKSISYRFCPSANDPLVQFDSLKVQRVVSNLLENAIKYTPNGGAINLTISSCFWDRRKAQNQFLFGLDRKGDRKIENAVCISVSDTGPGIPPEHQQDIFLEFVRLPQSSRFGGTGLGLAIVRRLVEAHEGVIWVESQPDKGSKFSLLLPS